MGFSSLANMSRRIPDGGLMAIYPLQQIQDTGWRDISGLLDPSF